MSAYKLWKTQYYNNVKRIKSLKYITRPPRERKTAMKAKYIGKYVDTSFGQYIIQLEYEYRGMRYIVTENRSKGNEPLSWQHQREQDWIDRVIEIESKPKKPFDHADSCEAVLDKLWNYFETGIFE